jgi:hypothetical protein
VSEDRSPLEELRERHGCARTMMIAYLAVGSVGGLYGGYLLAHEVRHWTAWMFSLFVLEPIGITCLFAMLAMIAPDSIAADILTWSLPRAKRAAAFVGVAYLLLVLALFAFVALEWMRG